MKAIAKDVDKKKEFSPTRSDVSTQRLRDEPERQLGSLREVIGDIRRNDGTPSVEGIATQLGGMGSAQRAPVLSALQQTHGNRYVQRVVSGIQAKLVVGQPGDMYEQEADRVADAVMRMPEPGVQRQFELEEEEEEEIQAKPLAEEITPRVRRQVEGEEEEILQTKRGEDVTPEVTQDLESQIQAIRGGGQPLTESDRAFFEPRFGHDFSQVRIHTDEEASESARKLNARAFTVGRNVFFRRGAYVPASPGSGALLAHELTHVVQQAAYDAGEIIQCDAEDDVQGVLDDSAWQEETEIVNRLREIFRNIENHVQSVQEAEDLLYFMSTDENHDLYVTFRQVVPECFQDDMLDILVESVYRMARARQVSPPRPEARVAEPHVAAGRQPRAQRPSPPRTGPGEDQARALYRGLRSEVPLRQRRLQVLEFYNRSTDAQFIETVEAWSRLYSVELTARIRDWADVPAQRTGIALGPQDLLAPLFEDRIARIRTDTAHRRLEEAGREAREEQPERQRQRVLQVIEDELRRPGRHLDAEFSRMLLSNYDTLSDEEQQATQGIIRFALSQPSTIPLASGDTVSPGYRDPWGQGRWILGRSIRDGAEVLVSMGDGLSGRVFVTEIQTTREHVPGAYARGARSAYLWVPVGLVVAQFSAFMLAGAVAPGLLFGPAASATSAARAGVGAARAIASVLRIAARVTLRQGPAAGGRFLGQAAYVFVAQSALAVTGAVTAGTEIAFSFAGYDTGLPIGTGDELFALLQRGRGWVAINGRVRGIQRSRQATTLTVNVESVTHRVSEEVVQQYQSGCRFFIRPRARGAAPGPGPRARPSSASATEEMTTSGSASREAESVRRPAPEAEEHHAPPASATECVGEACEPSLTSVHGRLREPQPTAGAQLGEGGLEAPGPEPAAGPLASASRGGSHGRGIAPNFDIRLVRNRNSTLRPRINSLLQEELGENALREYDYVVIGMPFENVSSFEVSSTGRLYAACDPGTAEIFARRASGGRTGEGEIGGVILAFDRGQIDLRPISSGIEDMPGLSQVVFSGVSLDRLAHLADIIPLPRGFFN